MGYNRGMKDKGVREMEMGCSVCGLLVLDKSVEMVGCGVCDECVEGMVCREVFVMCVKCEGEEE